MKPGAAVLAGQQVSDRSASAGDSQGSAVGTRPLRDHPSDPDNGRAESALAISRTVPHTAEAQRVVAIERRLLHLIQWVVFGGVILLTVGAGALSWSHLTHIAATNGHIAPRHLLFLFPTIVDGFMVLGSGVVVRHALTDELGWRTWYAGCLVAATASMSVCLNIQDSTGREVVPGWVLPGIAPTLYMLGTELGLAELRLLMRKLRGRIRQALPSYGSPIEPPTPSKKEIVLSVLAETGGHVPTALDVLTERGVSVDRSYVYEIKRGTTIDADAGG